MRGLGCSLLLVGISIISSTGTSYANSSPGAASAPVPTPPARLSITAMPSASFSVGPGDNASIFQPQTSDARIGYKAVYTLSGDGNTRLTYKRVFVNDVSDRLLANVTNAFDPNQIYSESDLLDLTREEDGPDVERYEVGAGYTYRHASAASSTTFTPAGIYHTAYLGVDYYFGPISHFGDDTQGFAGDSRRYDIVVKISGGPHDTSTAYLQSLPPGSEDLGAKTLLDVSPTYTFPVSWGGRLFAYVNYTHDEQYFDDTPAPFHYNDYEFGLVLQASPGATYLLTLNTLTSASSQSQFQVPDSFDHAQINFIAKYKLKLLHFK